MNMDFPPKNKEKIPNDNEKTNENYQEAIFEWSKNGEVYDKNILEMLGFNEKWSQENDGIDEAKGALLYAAYKYDTKKIWDMYDILSYSDNIPVFGIMSNGTLVECLLNVYLDSDIPLSSKESFASSIASEASEYEIGYNQFVGHLASKVDLSNEDKYEKNVALLESLRIINHEVESDGFFQTSVDYGLTQNGANIFLENSLKENSGSYILNSRVKQILNEDVEYERYGGIKTDKDRRPFQISKGVHAMYNEDGDFMVTKEKNSRIGILGKSIDIYWKATELSDEYENSFIKMVSKYTGEDIDWSDLIKYNSKREDYDWEHKINDWDPDWDNEYLRSVYEKDPVHIFVDKGLSRWEIAASVVLEKYPEKKKLVESELEVLKEERDIALRKLENYRGIGCSDAEKELESYMSKIDYPDFVMGGKNDIDIMDYIFLVSKPMRKQIKNDFNIEISELSLSGQNSFMSFIKNFSVDDVEKVQSFSKIFGINGAKTFLSIDQGGEKMGEKILFIGESYSQEDANKIFAKYAELVDATEKVEDTLKEEFPEADPKMVREISENLLIKGKKLLEDFADARESDIEKLLENLESIKAENILLVEKFKTLKKEGLVRTIEDLESISSSDFSGMESLVNRNIMDFFKNTYEQNYKEYSQEGKKSLINSLKGNLAKDGARVYTIAEKEKILSAMLVNENREGDIVCMSALNIDPNLKETAAGRVLLENTLKEYLEKKWTVTAEASPNNASHYIKQFGFVAYERLDDKDEDYILKLKKNNKEEYESQDSSIYTKKKIKEMALRGFGENDKIAVWMSYDKSKTPEGINKGYVITQMFRGQLDGEKGNYFLLEKEKAE